jgi:HPt (histidine-containing phosphotransfer) domain-containing protein
LNLLKRLNGFAVSVALLWSITVASVVYISSQEQKITHLIDEISFGIDKLRQTLFLAQPYRSRFSEQLELEIQIIHAQTVQLKSLTQSDLLSDVSHTVYLLERFVEQAQLLAQDEMRLESFISRINTKPTQLSQAATSLSNQLSAVVLDTLFNDTVEARQVYLKLEGIQREAYSLNGDDRIHVLELNSQASVLLSQAANTEFLVDRVVNHPVMSELSLRELQSEHLVDHQVLIVVLASLLAMVSLLFCCYQKQPESLPASRSDDSEPLEAETSESQLPHSDNVSKETEVIGSNESSEVPFEASMKPDENHHSFAAFESTNDTEGVDLDAVTDESTPIQFSDMLNTLDGDKESMLLLLGVFVSEHSQDADKLRNLVDSDIEQATRVAHTLKGVSGSIFAEHLRQTAISAELQLKQSQAIAPEVIDELEQRLKQAIVSAEDYISKSSQ